MKVNDAVSGAFFIALAGLIFLLTGHFTEMPGQNYGAGFFPRVIAVAMALLGAGLVVRGIRARGAGPWAQPLDWMGSPRLRANFLLVLGALVFYIVASDLLGFVITALILLFVLLTALRGLATWRSSAAIALVATLVIQQFFGQLLRVPLPWGLLQDYAW